MKEILILSGKGGTGKTSITACFCELANNAIAVDCDVDAANLHLVLNPKIETRENFKSGFLAVVDSEKCIACGLCQSLCKFDAITANLLNCQAPAAQKSADEPPAARVDELACEGCGVCADNCPAGAITLIENTIGELYTSQIAGGKMVHAKLGPGGENSGKLVTAVRKRASEIAKQSGAQVVIIDGPPGIGCPVIASAGGVDFAVLVTEPTPSGLHDLKRIAQLMQHFAVPAGIIINKSDLSENYVTQIENFAADNSIRILGAVPYDRNFSAAQRQAKTIIKHAPTEQPAREISAIWRKLETIHKLS